MRRIEIEFSLRRFRGWCDILVAFKRRILPDAAIGVVGCGFRGGFAGIAVIGIRRCIRLRRRSSFRRWCRRGRCRNRVEAGPIIVGQMCRVGRRCLGWREDARPELRIDIIARLGSRIGARPDTMMISSLAGSCMTSPGVSSGRDVSVRDTMR